MLVRLPARYLTAAVEPGLALAGRLLTKDSYVFYVHVRCSRYLKVNYDYEVFS